MQVSFFAVLFMGHLSVYNLVKRKGSVFMKTNRNEEFVITDGYLLVMEEKRLREEKKAYMWDVEDDGYFFEEKM